MSNTREDTLKAISIARMLAGNANVMDMKILRDMITELAPDADSEKAIMELHGPSL